jgi:hypothetical protein
MVSFKSLLLELIYSLTLADNISDVAGDVNEVLERVGFNSRWTMDEGGAIREELSNSGVVSLWSRDSVTNKE